MLPRAIAIHPVAIGIGCIPAHPHWITMSGILRYGNFVITSGAMEKASTHASCCAVSDLRGPHRRATSHFSHGSRIGCQSLIVCEERDPFNKSLSKQQPVERIFVDRRQAVDAHRVLTVDCQLGIAVIE
jgi:hypothetical protein